MLWPFQYVLIPKTNFPHHLFLQVIRIHDFVLLPLPWEVTFQVGKRISKYAKEKGEAAGLDPVTYIVISCSNDYWGYVTTAEEYTLQYYEGASNAFGPNTAKFIKLHMGHMVEALAEGKTGAELPEKWVIKLRARNFYPKKRVPKGNRYIHKHPVYYQAKKRGEPFWSFQWYDVPSNLIDFHRPLVCIEVLDIDSEVKWKPLCIDGQIVDDSGSDIYIRYLKKRTKKNMELYETRWYNPPKDDGSYYRFVIKSREGQGKLCSLPFK
jgi:neutral ceramidase